MQHVRQVKASMPAGTKLKDILKKAAQSYKR